MENLISPNFQNSETRQEVFEVVRVTLAACAEAEASVCLDKNNVKEAFTSHAERTVEVVGIFAAGLVPELAYHAALLHDVGDRVIDCEHDGALRQAAAQALQDYFGSNHIDKKGRIYIESLLADTFYIEREARRQRQQFYDIRREYKFLGRQNRDLEDEERSCLSNGSTEVGGDLWRINPPATGVKDLLELSERVNVESVIIKAAEVIDHLRAHDANETDAGLLRETLEAESLYAPLCEIWGLDAMAMTLRSLALKRRIEKMNEYGLLSSDEQEAIRRAQAAGDRVREFGGARQAIHRLFDQGRCREHFSVKPTQNGEILAEVREDFVRLNGDDSEVRIVSRAKTDGSRWIKGLHYVADGMPEAESMDDIGMTAIVESPEAVARVFGQIARSVDAHAGAKFKVAPSKTQAMYIQGSEAYIDSVRGQLPDDWQIETKMGDYQVAKFTFALDGVPVEIQFVTSEDRENARVGHTAHILYKMQQVGKEELSTKEITDQLKAIRSRKHKVSPNNKEVNARTNVRSRLFGRILGILR